MFIHDYISRIATEAIKPAIIRNATTLDSEKFSGS